MRLADSLIAELEQEAATTRRVLERVPDGQLSWRPHSRSMSLGQLALHVATTPGGVAQFLADDEMQLPDFRERPEAQAASELIPALDQSVGAAKTFLAGADDARLMALWRAVKDGKVIFEVPRIGMIRSIMLNHWYHHRGQLSVYLRLLDVPVPAIYGASADENPFANLTTSAR